MILGRERDGVFVDTDSVNAYEFTTSSLKAKSQKDADKLVELLAHLAKSPDNRYKTFSGWLVTESEPTAEQREAVRRTSQGSGTTLHILSYQALRARLCNVEEYLASRANAPFGSIEYATATAATPVQIEPIFHASDGRPTLGIRQIAELLDDGAHILATGEFGVGKSHALREVFRESRKRYFKAPAERSFPVHLNLRDCAGLRSPSEVLRRHAEEVGFANERGLVSAWRAGACTLLLDGFDEVIPSRWLGSATHLKEVRWDALNPVRRLISEAPPGTGIVVAGRGHYFSSDAEMQEVLGLSNPVALRLRDFDVSQAAELLRQVGSDASLPDWLPTRPLLLVHLLQREALSGVATIDEGLHPADAWRELLNMICAREANVYTSVSPSTIRSVIQRLATVARTKGDPLAPLARKDLEQVFFDVTGRSTDEEILQLLMRLPGLAVAATGDGGEVRVFADEDIASTAFGEDLAAYVLNPFHGHLLGEPAAWSDCGQLLAVEVCASSLRDDGVTSNQILAACDRRMDQHYYDAILMDTIRVADEAGANPSNKSYLVEGVLLRELSIGPDAPTVAKTHVRDSILEVLEFKDLEREADCPTLERCIIDQAQGIPVLPVSIRDRFPSTEIGSFAASSATTSGILSLDLDPQERVALSVLHKVYAKRGRGRKESALPRGLDGASQALVPEVVSLLLSADLLISSTRGSTTIYLPVKGAHSRVHRWLEEPQTFHLDEIKAG